MLTAYRQFGNRNQNISLVAVHINKYAALYGDKRAATVNVLFGGLFVRYRGNHGAACVVAGFHGATVAGSS
jgi:hypothetical protein